MLWPANGGQRSTDRNLSFIPWGQIQIIINLLLFIVFIFLRQMIEYSFVWPGTGYADQTGLKLTKINLSLPPER